jgi:hypothetical protein
MYCTRIQSNKLFVYGQIKELNARVVDHLSLSQCTDFLGAINIITRDCTLQQRYPSDQRTLAKFQFNRRRWELCLASSC